MLELDETFQSQTLANGFMKGPPSRNSVVLYAHSTMHMNKKINPP
jgi:hypothetical protein